MLGTARVISVYDEYDGDRIKARLLPADQYKTDENLVYAFPIIPKMFRVKPKVGEAVLILTPDDDPRGQRYYFGPIVSQPQYMNYDDFVAGATTLLRGAIREPSKAPSLIPNSVGCVPKDNEVCIYGRGNTDIILSEDDIRIRAGVRNIIDSDGKKEMKFNGDDPAFLSLKYYKDGLDANGQTVKSRAVLAGSEIVLVSTDGNPYFKMDDKEENISDEQFAEMIEKAHRLPYGDILVDFLKTFIEMFKSHTHKYHNMPPCPDDKSLNFDTKYPTGNLEDILLSKHIKIN